MGSVNTTRYQQTVPPTTAQFHAYLLLLDLCSTYSIEFKSDICVNACSHMHGCIFFSSIFPPFLGDIHTAGVTYMCFLCYMHKIHIHQVYACKCIESLCLVTHIDNCKFKSEFKAHIQMNVNLFFQFWSIFFLSFSRNLND